MRIAVITGLLLTTLPNIFTIFGTGGKIVADKHAYKIYLKEPNEEHGFHEGWNTRYITDFAESVRFYVRGNEFTKQLDYFVDCIEGERFDNISSFEEAHKTDVIMENIRQDAVRTLTMGAVEPLVSPILANPGRTSLWKKFSKLLGRT